MNNDDPWTAGKMQPKIESILEPKNSQILFRLFFGFFILFAVFVAIPNYIHHGANRGLSDAEQLGMDLMKVTVLYLISAFIASALAAIYIARKKCAYSLALKNQFMNISYIAVALVLVFLEVAPNIKPELMFSL